MRISVGCVDTPAPFVWLQLVVAMMTTSKSHEIMSNVGSESSLAYVQPNEVVDAQRQKQPALMTLLR